MATRPESLFRLTSMAALTLVVVALAIVSFSGTTEYYDSFDYIKSAFYLFGDAPSWLPRNPLFTGIEALLYSPFHYLGERPDIRVFRVAVFLLNLGALVFSTRWILFVIPELPWAVVALVVACNRIFLHFAPFALPDLFCAFCVALWLDIDSRMPLDTRCGKLARVFVLAAVLLGRPHSVLIAAGMIGWRILRTRKPRADLEVGAASFVIFVAALGFFYGGLSNAISFHRWYLAVNSGGDEQPWWVYFQYLGTALGWVGLALLLTGGYAVVKKRFTVLDGPLLGGALYLLFLMSVATKEARYLTQLLPLWAALQCTGLNWLYRKKAALASLAVAGLVGTVAVPELWRFTDPIYGADIARTTSQRIAQWSRSERTVFLKGMAALYPRDHYFQRSDKIFYIYHWAPNAYWFYTGNIAEYYRGPPIAFMQHGYPIPDQVQTLAPSGVTMVLPAREGYNTMDAPEQIEPIYALRWWPHHIAPPGTVCATQVTDVCLELYAAYSAP